MSSVAERTETGQGRIAPDLPLALPNARAALLQRQNDAEGRPLLVLYALGKEVSFDHPRQFALAERLAAGVPLTLAECAADLGETEAGETIAALLGAGLLAPADEVRASLALRHDHRRMPDPLPVAPLARPRSWMDEESLMAELTGRALDLAWLEAVVPVFRTAHLFLDRDGRQVGEANVFPPTARLAVETDWRGCPYAGNRYQPDKPMNATALRAMRKHWRQMMLLLGAVREGYLVRFPAARAGWTIGHAERLTVCALALPSLLLLDCAAPVANGALHPALSNLFRVVDGVRLVLHQMLFVPVHEPMAGPHKLVDADRILAYAERNYAFHSDHGVCAGPRFMVEDMLGVLLDGAAPRSGLDTALEPELAAAARGIPQAIDHALLGLQTHAAAFALWPAMAETYQALTAGLSGRAQTEAGTALVRRFEGHFEALSHRSFLAVPEWRAHRAAVYDDMFAQAGEGLGQSPGAALSARLSPDRRDGSAHAALAGAIAARLPGEDPRLASDLSEIIVAFLERARLALGEIEAVQNEQGRLLSRAAPAAGLTLDDLNLHNLLMGADVRSVPFLSDELLALFGVTITVTAQGIAIASDAADPAGEVRQPHPPAEGRRHAPGGGCPVPGHGASTVRKHT